MHLRACGGEIFTVSYERGDIPSDPRPIPDTVGAGGPHWCDPNPSSAASLIAKRSFWQAIILSDKTLTGDPFPSLLLLYKSLVRFATMTGTYGTFPAPGSSSMVAPNPRDAQDDAKSTHSGKRTASVDDQLNPAQMTSLADEDTAVRQDIGVTRIEALYRVFGSGKGKASIWLFYVSIGLISYAYSLSSNTVSNFFSFATSSFGKHSILGTVEVAIYVLAAVGTCDALFDAETIFGSLRRRS